MITNTQQPGYESVFYVPYSNTFSEDTTLPHYPIVTPGPRLNIRKDVFP